MTASRYRGALEDGREGTRLVARIGKPMFKGGVTRCAAQRRSYDVRVVGRNSTPTLSPDRQTSRQRLSSFGGRTNVNSAGSARVVETDTQAPPSDTLFSMPRSHGESSSNLSLTI